MQTPSRSNCREYLPCIHQSDLPFPLSPVLLTTTNLLLSLRFCLFWTAHTKAIMPRVGFCDWLFPLSLMSFKVHLWCSLFQDSFLFIAKQDFVWIYHLLFICSSRDEHLGYFHFLATMNNVVMNIHDTFFYGHVFCSFGRIPMSGIARSRVPPCLILWVTSKLFPKWLHHFTISLAMYPIPPHSHQHLLLPFDYILPMDVNRYLLVALISISLMANDMEYLFKCLWAFYIIFSAEMSIQTLCPFFNWVAFFIVELNSGYKCKWLFKSKSDLVTPLHSTL